MLSKLNGKDYLVLVLKKFYIKGNLVELLNLTDDFALARYVYDRSKIAKKLYERQDW